MQGNRFRTGVWVERLTTVAVVLVVAGSMYRAFWAPFVYGELSLPAVQAFSQLQESADVFA
jgi:hypothetical protein